MGLGLDAMSDVVLLQTVHKVHREHVCEYSPTFSVMDCSETYGRKWGRLQLADPYRTASSTTGGWSHWNILMCFIYIILSTTVSYF